MHFFAAGVLSQPELLRFLKNLPAYNGRMSVFNIVLIPLSQIWFLIKGKAVCKYLLAQGIADIFFIH